MKLSIDLTASEEAALRRHAVRLGVEPGTLAKAAIADLLGATDEEFSATVRRLLEKNDELYRRLA